MPAPIIRRVNESDAELAGRFIGQLDDAFLYCRARRRHRYPVLLPPKKNGRPVKSVRLPKGFSFQPIPSKPGFLLVTETCEICGRVCQTVTDRNAFLTGQVKRTYQDPPGYTAPKGTGEHLRGKVAMAELERRLDEGGLFGMPDQ
jgi:hypothetical protein